MVYPTNSTCLYLGLRGQYFEFVHGSTATGSVPLHLGLGGSAPSGSGGPSSAVGLTSLPIVNDASGVLPHTKRVRGEKVQELDWRQV